MKYQDKDKNEKTPPPPAKNEDAPGPQRINKPGQLGGADESPKGNTVGVPDPDQIKDDEKKEKPGDSDKKKPDDTKSKDEKEKEKEKPKNDPPKVDPKDFKFPDEKPQEQPENNAATTLQAPAPPKPARAGEMLSWWMVLLGVILIGLLIILLVRRWMLQQNQPATLDPNDQLAQFRESYEAGEMSEEEFKRVKTLLQGKIKNQLNNRKGSSSNPVETPKASSGTDLNA